MTIPNGPRRLQDMTEAQLRALIKSIVLDELVTAVGGTSYVGNLYGFEIGQRVKLNKLGARVYHEPDSLEGAIFAPIKADNDEGFVGVRRDDGSELLVEPKYLEAKTKGKIT